MGKKYTMEFKRQAIELAESLGNIKQAAVQLGIADVNIHAWKKRLVKGSKSEILTPMKSSRLKN